MIWIWTIFFLFELEQQYSDICNLGLNVLQKMLVSWFWMMNIWIFSCLLFSLSNVAFFLNVFMCFFPKCTTIVMQAGPYDSLKDIALKILQNKVATVPIIHSSSQDGSFPQLLHLASLSGILKCKFFSWCVGWGHAICY